MTGFTDEYLKFFRQLKRNNEREWFKANKKRFDEKVHAPFADLVAELIHRIGSEQGFDLEPKEAMFRIYRDTRFSKDKTPYKTFLGAVIAPGGRKSRSAFGLYVQAGVDGVAVAGGLYQPDKDQLLAVRRAIAADGGALTKLLNRKAFKDRFGELRGEKNKVLPKEFKEAAEKQPLIFNKQFYYYADLGKDILTDPGLAKMVHAYSKHGRPVNDWLTAALDS